MDWPDTVTATLEYPKEFMVTHTGTYATSIDDGGLEFRGDRATLKVDRERLAVYSEDSRKGAALAPHPGAGGFRPLAGGRDERPPGELARLHPHPQDPDGPDPRRRRGRARRSHREPVDPDRLPCPLERGHRPGREGLTRCASDGSPPSSSSPASPSGPRAARPRGRRAGPPGPSASPSSRRAPPTSSGARSTPGRSRPSATWPRRASRSRSSGRAPCARTTASSRCRSSSRSPARASTGSSSLPSTRKRSCGRSRRRSGSGSRP